MTDGERYDCGINYSGSVMQMFGGYIRTSPHALQTTQNFRNNHIFEHFKDQTFLPGRA